MKTRTRILQLAPALFLGATLAHAGGGVRMYGHGEIPQASEVADVLSGGATPMRRPKMRGISLNPAPYQEDKVQQGLDKVAAPKDTAIGLQVEFAFNSAAGDNSRFIP